MEARSSGAGGTTEVVISRNQEEMRKRWNGRNPGSSKYCIKK
jgi:hypothetical protein